MPNSRRLPPDYAEAMLQVAELLANHTPQTRALMNRAISTAYYAVFHTIQFFCARALLPAENEKSAEFEIVFRQLEHSSLRETSALPKAIKGDDMLAKILENANSLKEDRFSVDYRVPALVNATQQDILRKILLARETVKLLRMLKPEQKKNMAVYLLFSSRQSKKRQPENKRP